MSSWYGEEDWEGTCCAWRSVCGGGEDNDGGGGLKSVVGHTDDKSVVMCARGGEESLQMFAKSYKPGPHHDERGGGAVCDGLH